MAFRKLQFKNVNATRSTSIIGTGEVAVDSTTNSLYIGDDSTTGGIPLKAGKTVVTNHDGGAIDPTADIVFLAEEAYTLADGETVGHEIKFVINASGGELNCGIVVANASYFSSGNVTTSTSYSWIPTTIDAAMSTVSAIWDGSNWVLNRA